MRERVNRRGFTMVELLVVLVIGATIAAAVGGVLRRQQRFFTNATSLIAQRGPLRDATGILPGELRAVSPAGGDVLAFSDSSLELRATIGAAVACDTVIGGAAIDIAPARTAAGVAMSAFTTAPQAGDIALIFDGGVTDASADDSWAPMEIVAAVPSPALCAASPLVDPVRDANSPRLRLRFATGVRVSPTVRPGAFVRVLRRVRYRFYRASTSDWYLGYAEWGGSAFGVVQPVSGPFAAYDRRGGSGLALRFRDASDADIVAGGDASRIVRIEVIARAVPGEGLSGLARTLVDSQTVAVRPRNQ